MSRDFLARSSSRSNAIRRRSTSGLLEESAPTEAPPPTPHVEADNQAIPSPVGAQVKEKLQDLSKTTANFIPFRVDNLDIKNYEDLKRAIQHHQEMALMLSQYASNMGYATVQKM